MKKIFFLFIFILLACNAYAIKILITDPNIRPFRLYHHPYKGKNSDFHILLKTFQSLPNFQFLEEPRSVDFELSAEDTNGDIKLTLANQKTGEFFVYNSKPNLSSIYLLMDNIYEKITQTKGIFSTKIVFSMNWYGTREIFISDLFGKGIKKLTSNKKDSICPKISFDRKYVVYTLYEGDGSTSLRLINLSNYTEKVLYHSKSLNLAGSFTPDNNFLYFVSYDGKQSTLLKINLNDKKETLLYRSNSRIVSPVTTFREDEIAFVSDEYGSPQIFLFNIGSKSLKRVTKSHSYSTTPSSPREGGYLAYLAQIGGKNGIFITSYDNSELVPISSGNTSIDDISWLENERFLLASRYNGKESTVFLIDIPTQKYIKLFDIKGIISYLNAN